jgi:signal transduction histidine kinase/DNA-binding response OmpR family regulator/ligand-binding sensor domain-containing protein
VFFGFLLLIFNSFACHALTSTPAIVEKVINQQDIGVPHAIYQGKNTLWLAGENGFFAITGLATTHYSTQDTALENTDILDIFEDKNGRLWLASDGAGIHIFDPTQNSYEVVDSKAGLSSDVVERFAFLDANIVIANTFNGIALININTFEVKGLFADDNKNNLAASSIEIVNSDGLGTVYYTQGRNKLYGYDVSSKHLQQFSWKNDTSQSQRILNVFSDSQGKIWVVTKDGLNVLNLDQQTIDPYASFEDSAYVEFEQGSSHVFEDSYGQLWVTTNQLYRLDPERRILRNIPLTTVSGTHMEFTSVEDITQGKNEELYLVNPDLGLITLPSINQSVSILSYDDEYSTSKILLSHALSDSRLLLADRGYLRIFDGESVISTSTKDIGRIVEISAFSSQEVLVATKKGRFLLFDTQNAKFSPLTSGFSGLPTGKELQVTGMIRLEDKSMLVALSGGTKAGLYKGSIGEEFSLLFPGFIEHMMISPDGHLVFATRSGIFQQKNKTIWPEWDTLGNEPIRMSEEGNWLLWDDSKIRKNYVHHCLTEDSQGRLWVCTDSDGLAYFNQEKKILEYIEPIQIKNAVNIKDIVEDSDGYFWITTDLGLIRYDKPAHHSILIDESKGMLDSNFSVNSSVNIQNNQLFIAGDNYSYLLDTPKLNEKLNIRRELKSDVLFNQLYVHRGAKNTKYTLLDKAKIALLDPSTYLEIRHNEYLLSFELTTNNILERNVIDFEYRLKGLNDEWLKALSTQNVVSYITLPDGKYQFEARAVDDNSAFEQNITKLNIEVMPPFWRSWPAYALYALTILLMTYFVFKLRTRQLKHLNTELENAVKDRTRQLHTSKQQVSDLLSKKQSFFASVSHEFRTPLSLILGPLNVLLDKIDEPKLKQQVSLINRNAKRLNHMVDQVLDLARLDESKEIQHKTFSAAQAIDVIAQPFVAMANMKNQQLIIEIDAVGYLTLVDDSLEKIVANLLSNAIKFTPENGTITLKAISKEQQLVLSVEDNGIGIDKPNHAVIFERFTRVDGSEHIPGSGIGLALVKELVQNNGGEISLASKKGQGTTFTISFPLQSNVDEAQITHVKPSLPSVFDEGQNNQPQSISDFSTVPENVDTILIVEDNADMRSFIADSLSDTYQCFTAVNGRQGIDLAIEQLPDLIISDVMMPEVDGFELSETLRNHDTTSHIPLILLTAKGDEDSRVKGWNLDIDDYIAKPFDLDELKARIARLLAVRKILKKKFSRKVEIAIEQQSNEISDMQFTSHSEQTFFERFTQIIEENYAQESFGRAEVASLLSIGERQLNRKLNAVIDYNFAEYLRKFRLSKAKSLLSAGKQITEVSYEVGFSAPSYFSSCFKAEFGLSPKEFVTLLSN